MKWHEKPLPEQNLKRFTVKCLCCGGTNIQHTMMSDDGYSNWTVLNSGFIEFKCLGCGAFGTTNDEETGANNKMEQFEVTCNQCWYKGAGVGMPSYIYSAGDVEGECHNTISCINCNNKEEEK